MKYFVLLVFLISSVSEANYAKHNAHNVALVSGLSPTKLKVSGNTVSQVYEIVYGVSYAYRFKNSISLGVQGLSNNTVVATLGVGF